jgi:hypothetical protein
MDRFPTADQNLLYKSKINLSKNKLPSIVLIGYWPPTNEMLREFSNNKIQNINGWLGENWRGLGYNIYSYFPEFPDNLGIGSGDFQVDYQSTSKDFWNIVPRHRPAAVLSFGRSGNGNIWEIEMLTRNLKRWQSDYLIPLRPIPSPPQRGYGDNKERISTYPAENILESLQSQFTAINSYQDKTGAGSFLCEYLGYHISWYQALNPNTMKFGAHTHIGGSSKLQDLKGALKVSLESLIQSIKSTKRSKYRDFDHSKIL